MKWEYKSIIIEDLNTFTDAISQDWTKNMKLAGENGWELVSVISFKDAAIGYFKRPLTEIVS